MAVYLKRKPFIDRLEPFYFIIKTMQ